MWERIVIFIKYHNALPLGLMLIFLSVTGALAANEDIRDATVEAVLSKKTAVTSVDNSFIVRTNLDQFTPTAQITDVTEDDENYYIIYTLNTIDISDGVWGTISRSKEITVSKAFLGKRDLGLYLAKEIKEVVDKQSEHLKEVQNIERKNGATQKIVAITYSGLIGKFLDSKEEAIVGYEPIIPVHTPNAENAGNTNDADNNNDAKPQAVTAVESAQPAPATQPASVASSDASNQQNQSVIVSSGSSARTASGATMTMIGNNPARVPTSSIGGGYSDNGVRAQDSAQQNMSVTTAVNGTPMSEVSIDTRTPGVHTVRYVSADPAGETMALERQIIVYDRYKTKDPAIVLRGDMSASVQKGSAYADAGAIAVDYDDGDLSKKIVIENAVNVSIAGAYTVRYSVTDSNGNTTTVVRIVTVTDINAGDTTDGATDVLPAPALPAEN